MALPVKLGKLPARPNSVKLKLASYLNLSLPTPVKAGHQNLVVDWNGMLGNDNYGDCVFAGAAHETILWNKEAGQNVSFTSSSVLSDYSAVTGFNPNDPNTDQGTDMQVAASYRLKTGVKDGNGKRHKVAAYMAITPGNLNELKQAIYLFSNVGIGIQFPSSAMDQFNAGKPWTVVKGASIEGGHYVPAIGYDSRHVYVVTWGKVQKMSWAFFRKYCDEAIVYLSNEMLTGGKSLEGFNATQLSADLNQLTTTHKENAMFTISKPTVPQLLKTVELIVVTYGFAFFGILSVAPSFSKAVLVAANAAGLAAVYRLVKSLVSDL